MGRWLRPVGFLLGVAVLMGQQPSDLQILVIGGEGSINNVKQRTAREPVVEIRDRNNRPVAGAVVLFEAPRNGASGTFIGGSRTLRVSTDAQGRAAGQGFRPNHSAGNFNLQITASFQGATATASIHMSNVVAAGAAVGAGAAVHAKLIGILIGVGAAAAAGTAYAVTHSGSSSTPAAPPTTISAGTGTVGGRQ